MGCEMKTCEKNCQCEYPADQAVTCELCGEDNCGDVDCNIPNWRNSGWDVCTACDNDDDATILNLVNEIDRLQSENLSHRMLNRNILQDLKSFEAMFNKYVETK